MYDSGITANDFIRTVEEEADISYPIPKASWLRWITTVEQFVYSEVLNELAVVTVDAEAGWDSVDEQPNMLFDDIVAVYAGETELDRTSVVSSIVSPDKYQYWYDGKMFNFISPGEEDTVTIVYRVRPVAKTSGTEHIMLPVEWLDMVAARMRGEAYKIANEDGIAGKWLNDYNTQLESFKVWAQKRKERYGE